jgi:hypothetical protein
MANEKKITRIRKNGVDYFPYPQNFQSALDAAQAHAAAAAAGATAAQMIVSGTQELIGGKLIPYFDSGTAYSQYDLVMYRRPGDTEPHLFKALVNISPGEWLDSNWVQTSYYQELINSVNLETVRVGLKYSADASPIANKTVQVIMNGVTTNYTTDANGYIVFTAAFGTTYTVVAPNIAGYVTPKSVSKVANSNQRYINFAYRLYTSTLVVIKSDGSEVPFSLWNIADNNDAVLLKLETSAGNCCFKIHNTIGTNKKWSSINLQFPSLQNLDQAQATADYDGAGNTQKIEDDWAILVTTNPTLTIDATTYCRAETVTIGGTTYQGFLPAAGQLVAVKNNIYDINNALDTLGGNQLAITSGYWWSSSQNSQTYAWFLYNGSLNINNKNTAYQVLPFFDF